MDKGCPEEDILKLNTESFQSKGTLFISTAMSPSILIPGQNNGLEWKDFRPDTKLNLRII